MQRIYSGECPHAEGTRSICIDYKYVPIIGTTAKNYKKMSFDCAFSDKCNDCNSCPIYQRAPSGITE